MKSTMSRRTRNPFKSMTYRLPATYAVIALVVVLALGFVLYTTLHWYYETQERAYLEDNADLISRVLVYVLPGSDEELLQTQVSFFSFLARTRVEIFDAEGNLLADGSTFEQDPFFSRNNSNRGFFISSDSIPGEMGFDYLLISPHNTGGIIVQNGDNQIEIQDSTLPTHAEDWRNIVENAMDFIITQGVPITEIIPAFDPDNSPLKRALDRYQQSSPVVYSSDIYNAENNLLGTLRLSEGPAYGKQIIEGVMYGWLLASAVSVGLAIVLGWIASHDVINPLRTLSRATRDMADGNLGARATIEREDEFGALSDSFNDMAQRIEETVSTLRRFVSDAAHEINTPITALRTNLELINPHEDRETVERALSQVKRLENLTRNLLQLSRLESDMDGVSLGEIEAGALMTEVAQFHASQAEQAHIHLILDTPQQPLIIRASGEQMQQALSNLLNNAIKFTGEDGEIRLSVNEQDTRVCFTVEDTGIGISEKDLPFLFDRFHRGRNATRFAGNGLGLAIADAIVKRYGGTLTAGNTAQGARFTLLMPKAIAV